ncbi:MAG: hypothetical protein JXM70_27470 [Pirellulales bacterium]|nr:hypothetical protein [Pirellulales bacterium]
MCKSCEQPIRVPDGYAGHLVACSLCGNKSVVPTPVHTADDTLDELAGQLGHLRTVERRSRVRAAAANKPKSGVGVMLVLMILLCGGIAGGAFYYVLQQSKVKPQQAELTPEQKAEKLVSQAKVQPGDNGGAASKTPNTDPFNANGVNTADTAHGNISFFGVGVNGQKVAENSTETDKTNTVSEKKPSTLVERSNDAWEADFNKVVDTQPVDKTQKIYTNIRK